MPVQGGGVIISCCLAVPSQRRYDFRRPQEVKCKYEQGSAQQKWDEILRLEIHVGSSPRWPRLA